MKYLLLLLAILGAILSGCKPCDDPTDPECKNYDPCYGLGPVSAEFDMKETLGYYPDIDIDLDLENVTGKHMNIHPMKLLSWDTGNIKHQWIIGRDPQIREGVNELVTFGGYTGTFTVTHIVEGPARTGCFPEDDGRDTVTKTAEIIRFIDHYPEGVTHTPYDIEGKFEGICTHDPGTRFEMEMEFVDPIFVSQINYFQLNNFPVNCSKIIDVLGAANGFRFRGGYGGELEDCLRLHQCVGQLMAGGDSLRIDYGYFDYASLQDSDPDNDVRLKSTFYGKRK
ncbi:MAG: hypothetical protein AB8F95_04705 [Bacteroidia bacterium]